jgi:hypothetical protein
VDTGSQAPNLAWARDTPELVSFLPVKIVLSLVTELVFLSEGFSFTFGTVGGGEVLSDNEGTFENTFLS